MNETALAMELASVYRALGSRPRLKILSLLAKRSLCVNAIASALKMSQPAVSQHLEVLRQAGLVIGERAGVMIHYRLDRTRLQTAGTLFSSLLEGPKEPPKSCGGG